MKYVVGDEIMFDDEKYTITAINLRAKDKSKKIVLQEIVENPNE